MTDGNPTAAANEKETGRVEAFSDGVFGIALTLLVLELKVPHRDAAGQALSSAELARALLRQWPSYLAYVTSFISILIMWVNHHAVFRLIRKTDAWLLFANGFLLLMVTVVPFPTAIVAEHLTTAAGVTACVLYGGTFFMISVAYCLLLYVAFRKCICAPELEEATLRRLRRGYRMGPPLYFIATVAAPISVWITMGICTGLWVLWSVLILENRQAAD
jgi:uncharacterized membrane protein